MTKILNIIFLLFFLLLTCNGYSSILCIDNTDSHTESEHATIKVKYAGQTNSFFSNKLLFDEDNCDLCYEIPLFDFNIEKSATDFSKNKKQDNIRLDTIFVNIISNYDLNKYYDTLLKTSSLNNHLHKLSTIILIV